METFFYWAEILEVLKRIIMIVGGIISFVSFIIVTVTNAEDKRDKEFKLAKKSLIISLLLIFLTVFIPSKKTMYLMKGIGLIEESQKDTTSITHKTILLINKYLDEELKDFE